VLPVMLDKAVGHTEDISVSGIYATFLDLTARLSPGASVRLEMLFHHATPEGPLQVACEGEVVRADRRDARVSVAARITSYRFGAAEPYQLNR
jgi:PilZ domain